MSERKKIVIPVIAAIDGFVYETTCPIEPEKTTVAEILTETAVFEQLSIRNPDNFGFGSFGHIKTSEDTLAEDDRLEIFQRLRIDPMERRRLKGLEEKKAARLAKAAKPRQKSPGGE